MQCLDYFSIRHDLYSLIHFFISGEVLLVLMRFRWDLLLQVLFHRAVLFHIAALFGPSVGVYTSHGNIKNVVVEKRK